VPTDSYPIFLFQFLLYSITTCPVPTIPMQAVTYIPSKKLPVYISPLGNTYDPSPFTLPFLFRGALNRASIVGPVDVGGG